MLLASQNLEDFDQEGIREMTKPLFSIPPHQFLFNAGSIDKRSYMEMLQLDEAEYNLVKFPQRGVCLYKCGNERYLLEVHHQGLGAVKEAERTKPRCTLIRIDTNTAKQIAQWREPQTDGILVLSVWSSVLQIKIIGGIINGSRTLIRKARQLLCRT